MQSTVSHIGTVSAVGPGLVEVRLAAQAECGGCALGAMCGSHGGDVVGIRADSAGFAVGERVRVSVSAATGVASLSALIVAPLLLLLGAGALLQLLGFGPGLCAAGMIGIVCCWYGAMYLARGRIGGKVNWNIEKAEV